MLTKETEFALLKADVTWTKKKVSEISTMQKMMAEDLQKLSGVLLKDEATGFQGYISDTRDLVKGLVTVNKRVDKLQVVKKFIWSSMLIGSAMIGWVLKLIYDKI